MGWTYNTTRNVASPTNDAGLIVGVGVVFTLVSLVVVALRIYVRARVVRNLIIDDWIIFGTWFSSLIFVIVTIAQTKWGLGLQNVGDIPPLNAMELGRLQYAGAPFYILSIFGFKLSILFSFLRQAVDITYRKAITAIVLSLGIFHFLYFFIQLGICNPVSKLWNPFIAGTCIPTVPFHTAVAALTLIFNFLTLITPLPLLIFALPTLSLRKRIFISIVYTLSIFTALIQIPRLVAIHSSSSNLDSSTLAIWSIVEVNMGIICCSLLSLAPLFASLLRPEDSMRSGSSALSPSSTIQTNTKTKVVSISKVTERWEQFRQNSEVWKRIERFLGYGELPHLPRHNSHNRNSRNLDREMELPSTSELESRPGTSLSGRMGKGMEMIGKVGAGLSRMGSRMGRGAGTGESLEDLRYGNGYTPNMEWSIDMGGIIKTTEVTVTREFSNSGEDLSAGWDGRSSRAGSVSGVEAGGVDRERAGASGKGSPLGSNPVLSV